MNSWTERSKEVANLLNPALCCLLLTSSVVSYSTIKNEGMPFSLPFIILPVLMNEKSKDIIPTTPRTSLVNWLNNNPHVRLSLQERIISLKPYVQESILFGILHEWLFLTNSGYLTTSLSENDINKIISNKAKGETRNLVMRSKFIGKWFALSGTVETVMALWGVKP
jgi:hypothetical protein